MRRIAKGPEPRSLLAYRLQKWPPEPTYDGFPGKDELRESLLAEQGQLCGYCMARISAPTMKIEHWRPQALYPALQLRYDNLLGACEGGQGQPPRMQHCDTRKGNREIALNPWKDPERGLSYLSDGTIRATTAATQRELDDVLGLNLDKLKNSRKAAWDGVRMGLERRRRGEWTRAQIEAEVARLRGAATETLLPYHAMALYLLEKRLRRTP